MSARSLGATGPLGNVITPRAFSSQLTERTGPRKPPDRVMMIHSTRAARGRRSESRARERAPVDASCRRGFVRRPGENRSDDRTDERTKRGIARRLHRGFRLLSRARRAPIAIYCLSKRAARYVALFQRVVRANYPLARSSRSSLPGYLAVPPMRRPPRSLFPTRERAKATPGGRCFSHVKCTYIS